MIFSAVFYPAVLGHQQHREGLESRGEVGEVCVALEVIVAEERLPRHLASEGLYMMGPLYTFPAHRLEKRQLAGEQTLHLPQARYPKFAT